MMWEMVVVGGGDGVGDDEGDGCCRWMRWCGR